MQKKVDSLFSAEIDHLGVDSGSDVGDDSGGGVDSPVRIVINCCGLNGDTVCQVNDDHSTTAAASSSSSSSAAATTSYPIRGQVIRYAYYSSLTPQCLTLSIYLSSVAMTKTTNFSYNIIRPYHGESHGHANRELH